MYNTSIDMSYYVYLKDQLYLKCAWDCDFSSFYSSFATHTCSCMAIRRCPYWMAVCPSGLLLDILLFLVSRLFLQPISKHLTIPMQFTACRLCWITAPPKIARYRCSASVYVYFIVSVPCYSKIWKLLK